MYTETTDRMVGERLRKEQSGRRVGLSVVVVDSSREQVVGARKRRRRQQSRFEKGQNGSLCSRTTRESPFYSCACLSTLFLLVFSQLLSCLFVLFLKHFIQVIIVIMVFTRVVEQYSNVVKGVTHFVKKGGDNIRKILNCFCFDMFS